MQEILVYNTRTIMSSLHFGTSFMIFEESLLATLLFYPMAVEPKHFNEAASKISVHYTELLFKDF